MFKRILRLALVAGVSFGLSAVITGAALAGSAQAPVVHKAFLVGAPVHRFSLHTDHCYKFPVESASGVKGETPWYDSHYVPPALLSEISAHSVFCPVNVGTAGWQELKDKANGMCVNWRADFMLLSEHACNGANYELFSTAEFGSSVYYIFWNEYVNTYGDGNGSCANGAAPQMTAPGQGVQMEFACPDPQPGFQYEDQLFQAVAV